MQAAVRTILAGCANDIRFAFQQPTVRRRADSAFLATHASWRLFYGPYLGVCQATAAEIVTHAPAVAWGNRCYGATRRR